jgi:hypothetical protein
MLYSNDSDTINKRFKPSKCAQNSLNFISNNEELLIKDINVCDDIHDMVKVIYLLLDHCIDSKENSIKNLYSDIMPKLGVSNMSILY